VFVLIRPDVLVYFVLGHMPMRPPPQKKKTLQQQQMLCHLQLLQLRPNKHRLGQTWLQLDSSAAVFPCLRYNHFTVT
jgi:hypothetical protein